MWVLSFLYSYFNFKLYKKCIINKHWKNVKILFASLLGYSTFFLLIIPITAQEEYARGLKIEQKVMIIDADLKAALAFRMRGYKPIIVLAMPQSEELHREWIANDIFDFTMYNKR